MELKGSKTEANLWKAFASESKERNKYTCFASTARAEGYDQVAAIFEETGNNDRIHAKMWLRELGGIGNTVENLKSAIRDEWEDWAEMYSAMAVEARSEGFEPLAMMFDEVAQIEKEHEERFQKLLKDVQQGTVFKDQPDTIWYCRMCGHQERGEEAPQKCRVCAHPQSWHERKAFNY